MKALITFVFAIALQAQAPLPSFPGSGGGGGIGAVTCGATDKTICYNNAGTFGGATGLLWNAATSQLFIKQNPGSATPSVGGGLPVVQIAIDTGASDPIFGIRGSNGYVPTLQSYSDNGTLASPADVNSGDTLLKVNSFGYKNGAFRTGSSIAIHVADTPSTSSFASDITFTVSNQDGSSDTPLSLDGINTEISYPRVIIGAHLDTNTACYSAGGTCGANIIGSFSVAAASSTATVSTTAVTAGSQIFVQEDSSLGAVLGVTCNTQSSLTLGAGRVTARTAGTSFTFTLEAAPTTNPACFSYFIVN